MLVVKSDLQEVVFIEQPERKQPPAANSQPLTRNQSQPHNGDKIQPLTLMEPRVAEPPDLPPDPDSSVSKEGWGKGSIDPG